MLLFCKQRKGRHLFFVNLHICTSFALFVVGVDPWVTLFGRIKPLFSWTSCINELPGKLSFYIYVLVCVFVQLVTLSMICLRVLSTRFRFKFTFVVHVQRHICPEELPYIVDDFSGCLLYSHLLCAPAFSQSSNKCFSDEPLERNFLLRRENTGYG